MRRVYLDNNATTPLDPRVRDVMLPWLGERWGNASSIHQFGRTAREAVERARQETAALIGAQPRDIAFSSAGTESNNAVLWHVAVASAMSGHIVISALEHPSIRVLARRLESFGMGLDVVPPGPDGVVAADSIANALRDDTRLVCLMSASNELGTRQPIAEVGRLCRERGIWMHCDAVQSAGKEPLDVVALSVDSLTIGAHKFHGPLGAAALWTRPEGDAVEGLVGGSQESGRRAGTENVAALVGFGEACRLARNELPTRTERLLDLRERFEDGLTGIREVRRHCRKSPRLPHTSHFAALGVEGEALLIRLDLAGFAVSTGSACASGVVEPSPALLAMGLSAEEALSSLRISFGAFNTVDEVDLFLATLATEIRALRTLTPPVLR